MCGRYTQTAALDVLAERFGITVETGADELTALYNVAPSQEGAHHPSRRDTQVRLLLVRLREVFAHGRSTC
jgi:putative SOS response-associated peptidase YedK